MCDQLPIADEISSIVVVPYDSMAKQSIPNALPGTTDHGPQAIPHSPFPIPHSPFAGSHWLFTILLVAIAVPLLALAWPMLSGQVYTANDLGDFHLPLRAFYSQQLSQGQPFDWCPDLYCGFYLTG